MTKTTSKSALFTLAVLATLAASGAAGADTTPKGAGPVASSAPASTATASSATASAASSAKASAAASAAVERPLSNPPREPTPAAVRRAKEFFELAVGFAQKNDLEGAARSFQMSYEQDGGAEALANLAVIEKALGRPRLAAEHLDSAISKLPLSQADRAGDLKKRLAEMQQEIGTIELKITAADSEVYVDDKWISSAPAMRVLYVDPGEHNVRVQAAGATVRRAVTAKKGTKEIIAVGDAELRAGRAPAPVLGSAAPAPETPKSERPDALRYWIAGGAGVAFLATGAIGLGVYLRAHDERTKIDGAIAGIGGYCGDKPAPGFKDDCHARDQEASNETIGTVLATVGGLGFGSLALGGLILLITSPPAPAKSAGAAVSVRVRPALGGVFVEGRF